MRTIVILYLVMFSLSCQQQKKYDREKNLKALGEKFPIEINSTLIGDTVHLAIFKEEEHDYFTLYSRFKIPPDYFEKIVNELKVVKYGDTTSNYKVKDANFNDPYYQELWLPSSTKSGIKLEQDKLYWWNVNINKTDSLYANYYKGTPESGNIKLLYQNGYFFVLIET